MNKEETFVASVPQRYAINYPRYLARNGLVRPEDKQGFVAHGYEGDLARFYFMSLVFDQIIKENVRGDFAELGVYKGNTASVLAKMARRTGGTLYLFDTFEGFSEADLVSIDANKRMEFKDTSLAAVREHVGEENVRFIQGYFPGSTSQIPDNLTFSVVHIDCDLYLPFQSALEYFWPRMAPGGFLLMHDYSSLHWDGSEKAVDEFFADKAESIIPVPDASGTVVVRKGRRGGPRSNWLVNRKAALATDRWAGPEHGELAELIEGSWSSLEPWGVWGLGGAHSVRIYLAEEPAGDVEVAVDCAAALLGPRVTQTIDVSVSGRRLASWMFTLEHNQMLRTMLVPGELFQRINGGWSAAIDFSPHSVIKTLELVAETGDDRECGLGLYRVRQRELDPAEAYTIDFNNPELCTQFLLNGWSVVEPWGVWSLGPSHMLALPTARPGTSFTIEAQAVLLGSRTSLDVAVMANDRNIAELSFTSEKPSGVFSLAIPADWNASEPFVIDFRPRSTASPKQLDPAIEDTRPLGLGLRRLSIHPAHV